MISEKQEKVKCSNCGKLKDLKEMDFDDGMFFCNLECRRKHFEKRTIKQVEVKSSGVSGSVWDANKISRGTKCFGAWSESRLDGSNNCMGSFPRGFLKWVKEQGWHYGKVCHLCSGSVEDEGSFKVDIRSEMNPDLVADASDTGLPCESFDVVMLDPPYSLGLAKKLYNTGSYFKGIDSFTKEASRLVKKGGLIVTLTYQVPKRIKDCDFIAVWGVYTIPSCSYMRCFTVSRKHVDEVCSQSQSSEEGKE